MRLLFCKISNMKYYKGACGNDIPRFGGSFVDKNGYGHEEFNFLPIYFDDTDKASCLGFVEPKSNRGTRNTFHIERIEGCQAMKKEEYVDDVLVIWCAKRERGDITVVGWYKNAKVYRRLQDFTMIFEDGYEEERCYNIIAETSNCVLLPEAERNRRIWWVPTAQYTKSYGFGQSMIWYPTEKEATAYLHRLIDNIEKYNDENWINEYPE